MKKEFDGRAKRTYLLRMSNTYLPTINLNDTSLYCPRALQRGQWVTINGIDNLQFVKRAFDGTLWLQDKGQPVNYRPGKALVLPAHAATNSKRHTARKSYLNSLWIDLQITLAIAAALALIVTIAIA